MNLEDGSVEIIAEGESKNIKEFLEKINIRRYPIFVETVKVKEENYKGEFGSFKVIRDKDLQKEILSALSRGTVDIHEMKETLQAVKQDTSAIKQDTSAMLENQGTILEITEKGFAEVKDEIRLQRDDFRELFMHEVSELRGEIAEIKATLARMQAAG